MKKHGCSYLIGNLLGIGVENIVEAIFSFKVKLLLTIIAYVAIVKHPFCQAAKYQNSEFYREM